MAGTPEEKQATGGGLVPSNIPTAQCFKEHGELYTVELYARVRRAVLVEGMSERKAAREFGLARETMRKILHKEVEPRREQY